MGAWLLRWNLRLTPCTESFMHENVIFGSIVTITTAFYESVSIDLLITLIEMMGGILLHRWVYRKGCISRMYIVLGRVLVIVPFAHTDFEHSTITHTCILSCSMKLFNAVHISFLCNRLDVKSVWVVHALWLLGRPMLIYNVVIP